jgi:hypothetical protein
MRRKADRPNGRGLTYRERWERLRRFVSDPAVSDTDIDIYVRGARFHAFTAHGLREEMDRLDQVRVVKARPVQKRARRRR